MKKIIALILVSLIVLALTACTPSSSSYSGGSYSGGSSYRTCNFKEGGRYVCSSPCKSGSNFCSYHDAYLTDAYNSFVNGDWD
jgi:hypothetical protein